MTVKEESGHHSGSSSSIHTEGRRLTRKKLGAILLGLTLVLFIGIAIGYASNGGNPTVSEEGLYNFPWFNATVGVDAPTYTLDGVDKTDIFAYPQQPASYIVWKDGSTYYAKNGANGAIDYSGSDAVTIFQSVLSNCPNQTKIVIKGDFGFNNWVTVDKKNAITLQGVQANINLDNAVNSGFIVATAGLKLVTVTDSTGFRVNDTIFLSDASYSDTYYITNIAGNEITVNVNIVHTLNNGEIWQFYPFFRVTNSQNIVFDGITFNGNRENRMAGRFGGVYQSTHGASDNAGLVWEADGTLLFSEATPIEDITVKNCFFNNTPSHGVFIRSRDSTTNSTADNCLIQNCNFKNIGDKAIVSVGPGESIRIIDNEIDITGASDGAGFTGSSWGDGIQIHSPTVDFYEVHGNNIKNAARCGINVQYNYYNNQTGTITDNRVYNFGTRNFASFVASVRGISSYGNTRISNNFVDGVSQKTEDMCGIEIRGSNCQVKVNEISNILTSETSDGINVYGGKNKIVSENILYKARISLRESPDIVTISRNFIDGSNLFSTPIVFWTFTGDDYIVNENIATADSMVYLVQLRTCTITNLRIQDNHVPTTNAILHLYSGATVTGLIIKNNFGYKTENSGNATLTAVTSSIAVNHGCNYTPTFGDIQVTANRDLGNCTYFWYGDVTSTQFTIYVSVGGAEKNIDKTVYFLWSVRRH